MVVFSMPSSRMGSIHRAGAVERSIYSSDTQLQAEWTIHRLTAWCALSQHTLIDQHVAVSAGHSHVGPFRTVSTARKGRRPEGQTVVGERLMLIRERTDARPSPATQTGRVMPFA